MLRILVKLTLLHLVIAQNDNCVPMKMLQRKLCRAVDSGLQVFKLKVMEDLTKSPEDNHRYKIRIIRRLTKLQGKKNTLSFQQNGKFANRNAGNGKAGCKSCILEIPRDCNLETGTKYIVSALRETPTGVLEAGCDEMTEWAELSNFQRGRLLGHGYSCNVEICYDDCMDTKGCGTDDTPSACRLKRDDSDCYDKYAECAPKENSPDGEWNTLTSEFNSCLQLDNSVVDPFLDNPSSNSTNGTVTP